MSIRWSSYNFEGPYKLDSWQPPYRAAVYAIMYKEDPVFNPDTYTIVYFGETGNLSERGFPWSHEKSSCWISKAGSRSNLYIGVYYMAYSANEERLAVEDELIDQYKPACNIL